MTKVKNFLLKIWHNLEVWGQAATQSRVERYLAQSQNIVDLERRMKEIENQRYKHYI